MGLDVQSVFWVINFLVLGFLFGERAMRNILPLLQQRMGGAATGTAGAQSQAKG